jgi:hypothetical protein
MIGPTLEKLGYQVDLVRNGEVAIDSYQAAKKLGRPFAAVKFVIFEYPICRCYFQRLKYHIICPSLIPRLEDIDLSRAGPVPTDRPVGTV